MRGETAEDNIIFKIKLQDFEYFVRPEAIANQYPWLIISLLLSLGMKYTLEPL
jgi:hypothetical protein